MTLPPSVPSPKLIVLAAAPFPAAVAGAGYAHWSLWPAATIGLLIAAVAMIGLAVRASLAAAAREQGLTGPAGQAYDAIHAEAMIADISPHHEGAAIVELIYNSRQIVFLDEHGRPSSAATSGPGSIQLIARSIGRHGWRRFAALRRDRRALTITERGVQTETGRVVRECVLAAEDGAAPFTAEMAASTAFPRT